MKLLCSTDLKKRGNNMQKLIYKTGGKELIHEIKPLWESLNTYHHNMAINFQDKMQSNSFEKRHNKFKKDTYKVNVEIIKKKEKEQPIAYSITSLNQEGVGEIDSLFVKEEYRNLALGEKLMNNALQWLNKKNINVKRIKVAEGNEVVLNFYKKFGFETRFYVLEETKHR